MIYEYTSVRVVKGGIRFLSFPFTRAETTSHNKNYVNYRTQHIAVSMSTYTICGVIGYEHVINIVMQKLLSTYPQGYPQVRT